MFIMVLFMSGKRLMQPPVGEWMNKQGHLCNGMLFSDKSELSSHKKTWLDFKCILLNIRRLSEKFYDYIIK